MPHSCSLASLLLLVLPLTACSSDDGSSGAPTAPTERHGQRFPDVVDASARWWPDSPHHRRLMHVAATRAVHQLWLTCVGTPSSILPRAQRGR